MKNAMKKLMAFALVAVMLISAVPFQASAAINEDGFYEVRVLDSDGNEHGVNRYAKDAETGNYIIKNSVANAIMTVGYRSDEVAAVEFRDGGYTKSSIDGTYTPDQLASSNVTAIVSRIDNDTDDTDRDGDAVGGVDVDPDVYHEVEFLDMFGKTVAVYEVKDGDTLRETLNADLTKIQASAVADRVPSGYEFSGWKEANSNNYFTTNTVYHSNVTYMMVTQAVETEDENDNAGSGNTGSDTTGSGTTETAKYIKLNIYVDGNFETSKLYSESQSVKSMLATAQSSSWDFDYYTLNDSEVEKTNTDKIIELDNTVHVYFVKHVSKLNSNKVYLHVFMNNDFDDPVKNLNITNGIAKDGLVNVNGDVKELIKEYFSAKDSDGIGYDGLYVSTGDWAGDFLKDDKRTVVDDIVELKEEGYVHLNIMITNAKLKSASTADSTNPKTGDEIFVPVAIMTASACVLAAVAFYLNKKRAY